MIAVPREDGGVAVHGSLQCPYYIHKALKRSLRLTDTQAQVIQAETGGGFGGKEEYPSIIALHAALLARKTGKPVRMIYDRHEDLSATTKRHPAIVTHRTGVKLDGTLVAQDIDVVMDGGAYCTLTPVVLSRGAIHSGGPYRCPNVRIRARATRTNTPPNGAFRGFGAPQVEFAAELHIERLAERLKMSPLEIRRRNLYQVGDTTPTGQVLRDSVAASEVLERAAEAAEFEGVRARTTSARARRAGSGIVPDSALRTGRDRTASGIGIALAWHGAGFTGSGEVKLASVASIELTADGRIRILTGSTEMGQGTKTIFPQLVAAELDVPYEDVEIAPQDTAIVPDSGPTVASRTAMVVGGLLIQAARRLRAEVEERNGGRPFASVYLDDAAAHGATRIDQRFEPYPNVHFDDTTYHGDAYPAFGWAACVASVDVDLDTGEVTVRDVVAADDIGKVIHPTLAEGQVEGGTLQAIGYATIEEIKLRDGRYLNDRLATYIIPTSLDAPRITSILVEAPFASAPHGAKGVGELPMDVGRAGGGRRDPRRDRRLDPRPAREPGADSRRAGCDAAGGGAGRDSDRARRGDREGCRDRRRGADRGRNGPEPGREDGSAASSRPRSGRSSGSRTDGTRNDGPTLQRQRRPGRDRRAGHAAAARRPAGGSRADRNEGGLRGRGVRRLHGPGRRRCRGLVSRAGLPGRRGRYPDGGRAGGARRLGARPPRSPRRSSTPSSRPS